MRSLYQRSRGVRRAQQLSPGNEFWGVPMPGLRPNEEGISSAFADLVAAAYGGNSAVFACELTRMALFSEATFQWRQRRNGKPGDLFGTTELGILENPWPKGRTGDLLSRMIVDADLGGTAFIARRFERRDRLMRCRPDWVTIVLGSEDEPRDAVIAMDAEFLGIMFHPGGVGSARGNMVPLLADEVAPWSPIPDPTANFRGMSWLQPILTEIRADTATTQHKLAFFENGATPQMVVSMGPQVSPRNLKQFIAHMESHTGVANAYRTLYLGGGANVNIVGRDLAQLDFRATQGAGETRIASASGVHPVVAALSEGLQGSSLNAGNFNAARRIVADKTLRPLWRSACGALSAIVDVPERAELWFNDRDISFLQEDRKDAAEIQAQKAQTIRELVDSGFEPDSVVRAVEAEDFTLLDHTGLTSVQLQQAQAAAAAQTGQNGTSNGKPPALPVGGQS